MSANNATARETVAWVLWCANQGYFDATDRLHPATEWIADMQQNSDDRKELAHWLSMADLTLAVIQAELETGRTT